MYKLRDIVLTLASKVHRSGDQNSVLGYRRCNMAIVMILRGESGPLKSAQLALAGCLTRDS